MKIKRLSEAHYGGAFDIKDDQYFTKEDVESASEEVLNHIKETFNDEYSLGGYWFERSEFIVNIVDVDHNEYEASAKVDMRKIKTPRDLKKYSLDIASKIIAQIKDDNKMNESYTVYSISNKEHEKEVDRLIAEYEVDGWKPWDSKYSGSKYYVILARRGEKGGEFKAIQYSNQLFPRVIDINYKQAQGYEPIDDFDALRRELGRKLLPKREGLESTVYKKEMNENKEDALYDYKTRSATGSWENDDLDPLSKETKECYAVYALDVSTGKEYCAGAYNTEEDAHYWASMDRAADIEYGYGDFKYRVEKVDEYTDEMFANYKEFSALKLSNHSKANNENKPLDEATYPRHFKLGEKQIQYVKVYNQYGYTIQEIRIDNDAKTFERGNFSIGHDKAYKNRQAYEDFIEELVEMGYKEIPSDYRCLRNKTRKGVPMTENTFADKVARFKKAFDFGVEGYKAGLKVGGAHNEDFLTWMNSLGLPLGSREQLRLLDEYNKGWMKANLDNWDYDKGEEKYSVGSGKKIAVETSSKNEAWEPTFNPEDNWTDADIALYKATDWKARNYRELPVPEDNFMHSVVAFTDDGVQRKSCKFIKYIRANSIYPPYYAPETNPFDNVVGPMYDGETHNGYDIHNRYESQGVYDSLFESRHPSSEDRRVSNDFLERACVLALQALINDDVPFPTGRYLVDSWQEWISEIRMGCPGGFLLEDAECIRDFLAANGKFEDELDYLNIMIDKWLKYHPLDEAFIVTDNATKKETRLNDIKDVGDVVIGITGSDEDGRVASTKAANMKFGDIHTDEKYSIKCVKESLKESKQGFIKNYGDCRILYVGSTYVVTDSKGLNIGESPTMSGAETIADEHSKKSIKEKSLTEAPIINLSGDELNDPSEINFKKKIAKATEEERAEKERQEKEKHKAELMSKYKDLFDNVRDLMEKDDSDEALEQLYKEFVPSEGPASTVVGELARAIMRIMYRSYNDGDKFYEGYGLETCGGSAEYLYDMGFDSQIESILENSWRYDNNDDAYDTAIADLSKDIINYILDNIDEVIMPNDTDSRFYDCPYIESNQPRYEFEVYASEDIETLMEHNIIDAWDCYHHIEDMLSYEDGCEDADIDRPYSSSTTTFQISNLTREGYDRLTDLFGSVSGFWSNLVDEYSDELDKIQNARDVDEIAEELGGYEALQERIDEIIENHPGIEDDYDEIANMLDVGRSGVTFEELQSVVEYILN